ncbi:unnamed protein product [Thlaspi arvense]|uniref:Protein OBERON 4 n=1 Tax=Thlaspi arvense TaxID=13288 RepID=A0AAU9SAX8_THLAR|nr:unnamed protein product [Thlaspi arvense]
MACIKGVGRSASVALAPDAPYMAAGTMAGAVDLSYSSSANLEIFKLDFHSDDRDLTLAGKIPSSERFNRLAWGRNGSGSEDFSLGLIAGGLVDGNIHLWNPLSLIGSQSSENALVGNLSVHKGPVRGLEFNAITSNLLASGADDGEICIWDLAKPSEPSHFPLLKGSGSATQGEISFVSWNRKVQQIFASTSYNGTTVIWDLRKQKPIINFADSVRRRCSVVQWNPDIATQIMVASDDDSSPTLKLWDMRNTMSPVREFTGHQRGVIAMEWCPSDSTYLLTCAKDNRTICWDTNTAEIVAELPAGNNRNFDVHWYPKIPGVIAASSFDGKIAIYNIESCIRHGAEENTFGTGPLKAPKWYKRPVGASFGYGGKLVSFHAKAPPKGASSISSEVSLHSLVTEQSLVSRTSAFEAGIQNGDKTVSGRRGPVSLSRYDRDRQPFVSGDDAGFSRTLSRRRSDRDFDSNRRKEPDRALSRRRDFDNNRRKEPDIRYREDRLHRSESACFSRRAFPKGFRSERERPKREDSVSSWRRFGGLRLRDGERERSVRSPSWSRDSGNEHSKLKLDSRNSRSRSRNSRSRSKSLASPTWSKDSGSEQSKSVGNVVKKSEDEVQGKSSRSSSEMEEGELEPEPQLEPASGAAHTTNDDEVPSCDADGLTKERIDTSFQKSRKNAEFDDNVRKSETESNREASHVGVDREMKTAESMMDRKSVEKGENLPEHAIESVRTPQNKVNDISTALASEHELIHDRNTDVVNQITDIIDDRGDTEEDYKESHEIKLEESLYPAVPERFKAEEVKRVKGSGGDANKAEVEAPKCVEEDALGNRSPAKYISIVSDSSIHKCEDKGKNLDVPLTQLNAVFSEQKSEDLTDRDKDEDDNYGGPSIRGFELFSRSPVRKTNKTEQSGVNKPKDEKLLLESLDLSLSLPDVLLPIRGQDSSQPLCLPARSESVRSLTDTFCTDSEGFTMSMSFSGSRSFNHNPSCSLNHNTGDNEQSVHSRPIFQGIDWQALSHNDSRYNENTVYERLMENGNGSAMKGVVIPGQADEEHFRLEKQLSFQKRVDVRSACPRTVSLENDSKKKAKDFFGGNMSWISDLEAGGDDFVETVIRYILSDSMDVMTKRFHEMPTRYITSLKENIRQIMLNRDRNVQLSAFQNALQSRTDITLELLTKSHRAQLEILVALKSGRSDFLQLDNSISLAHLAEIYMNMRCKNLSCRNLVPVDECDCRICSRKDGFCSACMCLVCSDFDMASNTCSWVGCDVCLHWCHTDCGIRESYIRNGINASGAPGMTEMQFHCVACNHPSEMFGFVKEVFLNFAREWKFERFCKELEYVSKIFSSGKDFRGKQLRQAADAMLASLKCQSIDLPEACNRILGFISDCDSSSTPGETCAPFRYEQPKPRHEKGSPSQDMAWLRSVCSDKPHHELKRPASVVGAFQSEMCGVETGMMKRESAKKPRFEELESIVRMKQAEAEMFQGRADEARREAEGLKRIAIAKKEKVEEEYKRKMGKLSVEEAEERRRRTLEELEAIERGQREFYEMKMRMEEEMRGLLTKMELTKQSLAL